jgi:3-deoxy-D-arabino-heptulosonate 7-phosphate (DAHP) synthase class II
MNARIENLLAEAANLNVIARKTVEGYADMNSREKWDADMAAKSIRKEERKILDEIYALMAVVA